VYLFSIFKSNRYLFSKLNGSNLMLLNI